MGRRRLTNQDAFLVDDDLGLYVVADGMGGHKAGEVASQEAVDALHNMVRCEVGVLDALDSVPAAAAGDSVPPPSVRQAMRLVESAVQAAAYIVFGIAQADPGRKGMGTTVSVLALRSQLGIVAQVGDSRIYRVRNGQVSQLTEDHTLVAWQLKRGLITESEARISRYKNVVTRAVGSREYVQVDTRSVRVQPADAFLLCSDGLHQYLDEAQIAESLRHPCEVAAQKLVAFANQRGGQDNITAVVVRTG